MISPVFYIGSKLFYLGYRMQPLRIRRGISLMLKVGMAWADCHDDIMQRHMNGEHLDLTVDFTTKDVDAGRTDLAEKDS